MSKSKAITKAFEGGHPFHQMMGDALEELGGLSFIVDWAEDNPTDFIKIMLLLAPPAQVAQATATQHLHLHQDLKPGRLDGGLVINEA